MVSKRDYSLVFGIALSILILVFLKLKLFNPFFYTGVVGNQGIDYFALPKGFLNLLENRSIFDTWGGTAFGPYATWYIAHPAFAVMVMPLFSLLPTWASYWIFIIFGMACSVYSAYVFSSFTVLYKHKYIIYFLLLCTFPMYLMLYVGNMHFPVIITLSLLFAYVYSYVFTTTYQSHFFLMAALLISFFSKPVVLLMLPALLCFSHTRRITLYALAVYAAVSFLFIIIPFLNPESVGITNLYSLTIEHLQAKRTIYTTGFRLTPLMKDNFMHWVNLVSMSDYYLKHIEIFGFATFFNELIGRDLPSFIYKIPVLASVIGGILFINKPSNERTFLALLYLLMAVSLTVFISYNLVWEYQYASISPLFAMSFILFLHKKISKRWTIAIALCAVWYYIPSPFFTFSLEELSFLSKPKTIALHACRALPVFLLFWMYYSLFLQSLKRV